MYRHGEGSSYWGWGDGGRRGTDEFEGEVKVVMDELRSFKPYLLKRQELLQESESLEFGEDLEDVEFYLDVIGDAFADQTHGLDNMRGFIPKLYEMARKHPVHDVNRYSNRSVEESPERVKTTEEAEGTLGGKKVKGKDFTTDSCSSDNSGLFENWQAAELRARKKEFEKWNDEQKTKDDEWALPYYSQQEEKSKGDEEVGTQNTSEKAGDAGRKDENKLEGKDARDFTNGLECSGLIENCEGVNCVGRQGLEEVKQKINDDEWALPPYQVNYGEKSKVHSEEVGKQNAATNVNSEYETLYKYFERRRKPQEDSKIADEPDSISNTRDIPWLNGRASEDRPLRPPPARTRLEEGNFKLEQDHWLYGGSSKPKQEEHVELFRQQQKGTFSSPVPPPPEAIWRPISAYVPNPHFIHSNFRPPSHIQSYEPPAPHFSHLQQQRYDYFDMPFTPHGQASYNSLPTTPIPKPPPSHHSPEQTADDLDCYSLPTEVQPTSTPTRRTLDEVAMSCPDLIKEITMMKAKGCFEINRPKKKKKKKKTTFVQRPNSPSVLSHHQEPSDQHERKEKNKEMDQKLQDFVQRIKAKQGENRGSGKGPLPLRILKSQEIKKQLQVGGVFKLGQRQKVFEEGAMPIQVEGTSSAPDQLKTPKNKRKKAIQSETPSELGESQNNISEVQLLKTFLETFMPKQHVGHLLKDHNKLKEFYEKFQADCVASKKKKKIVKNAKSGNSGGNIRKNKLLAEPGDSQSLRFLKDMYNQHQLERDSSSSTCGSEVSSVELGGSGSIKKTLKRRKTKLQSDDEESGPSYVALGGEKRGRPRNRASSSASSVSATSSTGNNKAAPPVNKRKRKNRPRNADKNDDATTQHRRRSQARAQLALVPKRPKTLRQDKKRKKSKAELESESQFSVKRSKKTSSPIKKRKKSQAELDAEAKQQEEMEEERQRRLAERTYTLFKPEFSEEGRQIVGPRDLITNTGLGKIKLEVDYQDPIQVKNKDESEGQGHEEEEEPDAFLQFEYNPDISVAVSLEEGVGNVELDYPEIVQELDKGPDSSDSQQVPVIVSVTGVKAQVEEEDVQTSSFNHVKEQNQEIKNDREKEILVVVKEEVDIPGEDLEMHGGIEANIGNGVPESDPRTDSKDTWEVEEPDVETEIHPTENETHLEEVESKTELKDQDSNDKNPEEIEEQNNVSECDENGDYEMSDLKLVTCFSQVLVTEEKRQGEVHDHDYLQEEHNGIEKQADADMEEDSVKEMEILAQTETEDEISSKISGRIEEDKLDKDSASVLKILESDDYETL